ncbi:uncharacterized protein DC041_0005622 [Schistosoma bovis]|uniref:Uncharacterized protein n=1 Tax=Schistosoma bovis TaxID=6184 RepID=A0A430QPK2_SCHBO|nr:uncharacterized protein DC041_0005622 [Schistosoma bovis]
MYSLFQEIDEAINRAKEKGYSKVVEFGAKGLNYAAKAVLSGALLIFMYRASYSVFEFILFLVQNTLVVLGVSLYAGNHMFSGNEKLQTSVTNSKLINRRLFLGLSNVPEDTEHSSEDPQSISSTRHVSTRRTNVAQETTMTLPRRTSARRTIRPQSTPQPIKTIGIGDPID